MQNDRPLVLTAVQQNWRALQYASIRLRGDRDVVLEDLLSLYLGIMEKKMETTIMGYIGVVGYIGVI